MDEERRKRVLIVDDEANQRSAVSRMVERWGFAIETAADGQEALDKIPVFQPHTIVTDIMMPGMDGMELLKRLNEAGGAPPVIVLTAFGSMDAAVTTVHELGAFWFVEKPIRPRAFHVLLDRAVSHHRLYEDKERLERQLSNRGVFGKLIGSSAAMQQVFFLLRQAAPSSANILIQGESGTGKELVARLVHDLSPRAGGPFVAMNCAALPETLIESELFGHEKGSFTGALTARQGCFELANHGTLLLDEIGEMPLALQSKLLRVLEDRRIRRVGAEREIQLDVRVLAATNRDLGAMAKEGKFREDLYYRLTVLPVSLPPLRDRLEDIPDISEAMLGDLNPKHGTRITGIQPAAMQALMRYQWPGNVRELRNVIERACVLAAEGDIRLEHLPAQIAGSSGEVVRRALGPIPSVTFQVGATLERAERDIIELTLMHTKNNRTRAAEILGINQKTLYNKLKEYGEEPGE
ncbi:sigma-54-dependent transcriptional regulator [Paludibaculum fermentans]|uniref:Sigma-54-dependent Fis family transcriptional regulator n=1 Tax=Paludibaculum fermentans TaxID=1473598 RepID=A0A7S7NU15_PALFE|nr:sigma-54 dependent transcriptional regulator [Paludibaculum fermentans]QOY89821.1 sigma-54-dependent Fis family transcriptional regulator [Paludibaculum fermentans]